MNIVQVGDEFKEHWDNFLKSHAADGGLLQSWGWGDLQKDLGHKVYRLAVTDDSGQLQAVALLVKHELPFEYNYLYCPRGPVFNVLKVDDLNALFTEIKNIAREEKSFLVRVDPAWLLGNEKRLTAVGFRKSEYEVQPKCNFVVDLSPAESELLAGMKQKTRYNIGLAQRHHVTVRVSTEISDLEPFWQLTKETGDRDGFKPHQKEHYKKLFETFNEDGTIKFFIAEYNSQVLAVNMISFSGEVATYLHGASSDLYRDVMAPYLLQWTAITEAKRLGFHYYDFGGVNGKTFYNKKWQGITRFKTAFSARTAAREYIGSFDLVLNPVVFSVYKFAKQMRG